MIFTCIGFNFIRTSKEKQKVILQVIKTTCWYSDGYKLYSSCSRFFLSCYERDFMTSLSNDSQADIIEANV